MRVTAYLPILLCASLAAASSPIDAFKRVDRVLEPRAAAQHNAPTHSHQRLQKRASPYLNNVTQSECIIDVTLRPEVDWVLEYVVDGTKIPDVDVCGKRDNMALSAYKDSSILASHMPDWFQYLPPPTRLESYSFGMSDPERYIVLLLCSSSTFRFFPSTNPAATDEVVIW